MLKRSFKTLNFKNLFIMVVNPTSFTYEHLSNLKFKELQKLSVQFHVNKRWAKKQELIEKLLAIRDENFQNDEPRDDNVQYKEKEWRDGSVVFQNLKPTEGDKNCIDKRLTFNVDKTSCAEINVSRLTFNVPKNETFLFNENEKVTFPKATNEISSKKFDEDVGPLIDPRATFQISKNEKLLPDEFDPRATFDIPQNGKNLFQENEFECNEKEKNNSKEPKACKKIANVENINVVESPVAVEKKEKNLALEMNAKDKNKSIDNVKSSQVKMLTIPCTRVLRRNKKDQQNLKCDESPIRMSRKSITIKKSKLPAKLDLIKSPGLIKKPNSSQPVSQSLTKLQSKKVTTSKIPITLNFSENKVIESETNSNRNENDKENIKNLLRRRKSRTADEVLSKESKAPKASFMSPPVPSRKSQQAILPLRKNSVGKDTDRNTPGKLTQSLVSSVSKPITATKMPDFNKIHQKRFEQMDSLYDYLKKKEERTRKLFGTPQQGTQPKVGNVSSRVFKFQSSAMNPESKLGKSNENLKNVKTTQKEVFKNKLPPSKIQTDIKDKNRSHIHGVRTNKRFELQMKLRNM